MSLLEYKNKFTIDNPRKASPIGEQQFFRWTNKNFYRTSYHDMGTKVINIINYIFCIGTCQKQKYGCTRLPRLHARRCF